MLNLEHVGSQMQNTARHILALAFRPGTFSVNAPSVAFHGLKKPFPASWKLLYGENLLMADAGLLFAAVAVASGTCSLPCLAAICSTMIRCRTWEGRGAISCGVRSEE